MAIVTGTIKSVYGFNQPGGPTPPHTISADEHRVENCFVTVEWVAGTYASADDATFDMATEIADTKRDGKTYTILQACFAAPGDENGTLIGAEACTVSSNVVTCELTQEDLATERADGAMNATWNRPITFSVTYHSPVD